MEKMKQEAMIHIAQARREWMRSSNKGLEHMIAHMDTAPLWACLPQIWEFMNRYDEEANVVLCEMARFLGRELAGQASHLAYQESEEWIDEVWDNRHDPNYVPPWDKT